MLIVLSPAKRLDWAAAPVAASVPQMQAEADALAAECARLGAADLTRLMGLSDKLAALNAARFAAYSDAETRPAAFAFAGDTYAGLEARTLDAPALDWAQAHVGLLSGLYGLLRPLDAIAPHRLEMGTRLATERGATLYDWWGERIARAAEARAGGVIVNCASAEYFGALARGHPEARIVTPVFLEDRDGDARVVSFFAKRARGAMARFAAERRPRDVEDLRAFDAGGYRFDPARSTGDRWAFVRPAAAKAA